MRCRVGQIPVDVSRAESARFRFPILLLHGLWTGSWIWQPLAGFLAHRGWELWAPSLLEAELPPVEQASASWIQRVRDALPSPPILIAHDTASVAAVSLADALEAPALVAVAPVVAPVDAGERGIFAWPRFWAARLWGPTVAPPAGSAARTFLGSVGGRDRLLPDSGPGFRALASGRALLPGRVGCPGLIVAGARDLVATPVVGARIAERYGWPCRIYEGRGHFPMLEGGWEHLASDLHRWIVQTLGERVVLFEESGGESGPEGA